jgi:hypothetical protein
MSKVLAKKAEVKRDLRDRANLFGMMQTGKSGGPRSEGGGARTS